MKTLPPPEIPGDAALVELCLRQDRDAFGQIVARYQSLICSLAYSGCGNKGRSEDLAQETFLTAWQNLSDLREPASLKSWLCGIVRNLSHNALRREVKTRAEPLETDLPATGDDPHELAVSREEQAIVGGALEAMPAEYREPLVLYYREGQSSQAVAEALDFTEEAVWQRLSRGRKMLKESVSGIVEAALGRSAPGRVFTLAVLAVLPIALPAPAKAAGLAATTAKSGMAAPAALKALGWGSWGVFLGGNFFLWRQRIEAAKSPRERCFEIRQLWLQAVLILVTTALAWGGYDYLKARSAETGSPLARDMAFAVGAYAISVAATLSSAYWREGKRRIQKEEGTFVPAEWAPLPSDRAQDHGASEPLTWFRWAAKGLVVLYAGQMALGGRWVGAGTYLALAAILHLRRGRTERRRSRFLPTRTFYSFYLGATVLLAAMSLILFDGDLAKGKLGLELLSATALGVNAAVLGGYGLLWGFLLHCYRGSGEDRSGA